MKGLFLHVEFVQPRRCDPQGGPKDDAIAVSLGLQRSAVPSLRAALSTSKRERGLMAHYGVSLGA